MKRYADYLLMVRPMEGVPRRVGSDDPILMSHRGWTKEWTEAENMSQITAKVSSTTEHV